MIAPTMTLRDHPLMSYRGLTNWPPMWCRTGFDTLSGEIGVLVSVDVDRTGNKCYLGMDIDGLRYIGTLLFTDTRFCWLITKLLKNRVGIPIENIGDLDLSYTL